MKRDILYPGLIILTAVILHFVGIIFIIKYIGPMLVGLIVSLANKLINLK
jgi:hypothetical protein